MTEVEGRVDQGEGEKGSLAAAGWAGEEPHFGDYGFWRGASDPPYYPPEVAEWLAEYFKTEPEAKS